MVVQCCIANIHLPHVTWTLSEAIIAIIAITCNINLVTRIMIVVDDILLPQRVTPNGVVVYDGWWTNCSCWDVRSMVVFYCMLKDRKIRFWKSWRHSDTIMLSCEKAFPSCSMETLSGHHRHHRHHRHQMYYECRYTNPDRC